MPKDFRLIKAIITILDPKSILGYPTRQFMNTPEERAQFQQQRPPRPPKRRVNRRNDAPPPPPPLTPSPPPAPQLAATQPGNRPTTGRKQLPGTGANNGRGSQPRFSARNATGGRPPRVEKQLTRRAMRN